MPRLTMHLSVRRPASAALLFASFGVALLVTAACASPREVLDGGSGAHVTDPIAAPAVNTRQSITPFGPPLKTSGCVAQGGLPDPACTPGAVFEGATTSAVCVRGYSASVRDVSAALKRQVYAAYGIRERAPGEYEVDHLVNLSIGGSNAFANLWPELANPVPGYKEKDVVELYLQDQVCRGRMPVDEAQHAIATNWLAVYDRISPEERARLRGRYSD